ncbi:argonaute-like protein [Mycena pura]|uniref:Argonaute-like protein n=1 Tax=Mycena pura TaxID=153505 RepID=A0AAD6Y1X9_9AGAR|nr:argonaute-like protein [Mycena pura]
MADQPVTVITNNFVISSLPTRTYFQYESTRLYRPLSVHISLDSSLFSSATVAFTPPDPKSQKRHRLIHSLQTSAYPKVFHPPALYDGGSLLYSSHPIPDGTFRVHGSNQSAPADSQGWYQIKLSRTTGKEVVPAHVKQLMREGTATPETTTATNLLQLLLCQAQNLVRPNTGRAYFFPEGKESVRGMAVELWRGFYQAVRPSIGKMLVTVDVTVAAMYMSGSLMDVALAVLNTKDVRNLGPTNANQEDFRKLAKHLKNRLITTQTSKGRTKTIRGIVPGPVGRYEFQASGTGPTTTIGDHFRRAHNITIKYPETIGVVTSGKGAPFKVVVPLELCQMLPGQLYKKKLPPAATATVVSFAALHPNERRKRIEGGPIQEYKNSEFLVDSGMAVSPQPMTIMGRMLQAPSLLFGNKTEVRPRDGAWNVLNSQFHSPAQMNIWGVVNFAVRASEQVVHQTVIPGIVNCCSALGMRVSPPPRDAIRQGNGHDVGRAIEQVCTVLGPHVDMIVILLPQDAEDLRTRVKNVCDVKLGVRSQCLRESKFMRGNNQYFNNVALKLNARLGGRHACVMSPVLKELSNGPFMIMGADVSHPAQHSGRPSVASFPPRMEVIEEQELKGVVKIALIMFGKKYRTAPRKLFFFRDGVSESEFAAVREVEITAINGAINELWAERNLNEVKPKLTFIVVGKRHHVSFFPLNPQQGDRSGNCRAGLVVDRDLANPQYKDFYLQSHAAIKGTSRSAHYTVLLDENYNENLVKLQELSFALCHVYAKATRSVSIPAPVYYADLACARGKFYIDPTRTDLDIDGSTTTGGDSTFNLDHWKAAYQAINQKIQESMYFL